jgi:ABC-type Fe3+/spermidine/putrescine transport system ATPase subunit
MHEGRIHQVGTPTEVYEHPATLFVADFVGESNTLRGVLEAATAAGATVRLLSGGPTVAGPPAPGPPAGRCA